MPCPPSGGTPRRVKAMRTGITAPNSCWFLKKLANLSTITREWVALQSVGRLPFVQDLLTAKVGRMHANPLTVPPEMKHVMEQTYNHSQVTCRIRGSLLSSQQAVHDNARHQNCSIAFQGMQHAVQEINLARCFADEGHPKRARWLGHQLGSGTSWNGKDQDHPRSSFDHHAFRAPELHANPGPSRLFLSCCWASDHFPESLGQGCTALLHSSGNLTCSVWPRATAVFQMTSPQRSSIVCG